MIISNIKEVAQIGQPFFRLLCSDFHLGSQNSNHDAIVNDLQKAKDIGARILVNGDVFDCIGSKDKRFDLSVLHTRVAREKDLTRAIVNMAKEIIWPYRKQIDVMGIGNHEETYIDYGYTDPVRLLIDELMSEDDCKIKHGSIMGYIKTSFAVEGYRRRPSHKLMYLHGTGGDSPVTKGTIDMNRKGRNWVYDALTFGHKHNLVCMVDQIADVSDAGKYREKKQLNLQTGSYYLNYAALGDAEVLNYSYATRKAHPPKPMGGVFLCMVPKLDANGEVYIDQDFMSDVIVPWKQKRKSAVTKIAPVAADCAA